MAATPLARATGWLRHEVQLGGALLAAVVLPFSIGVAIRPGLWGDPVLHVSVLAAAAAIACGFWLFRNLIAFPGIRASYYLLPVFSSTFAGAFAILFLARLAYSRPLLVASFALALVWFYLVYFMIQRRQRLTIAVVPAGGVDCLYPLEGIGWKVLDSPHLPPGCTTLTADFDHDLGPDWERFLAECALAGVSVLHYKQLRQSLTGQVQLERLSENAFGSLMPNQTYLQAKLIADFVLAIALLPLALPLMATVAVAVRLDSAGPVFFRQVRIGYRGRQFRVWKFRTMRGHAPPADHESRAWAMTADDDARVTRIGRMLRRTRLDEVPQIINVLRGEMSWIGPRPEAAVLSRWYEAELPFYRYRHIVRPGISGWAQVNQGHVTDLGDVLTKLSYDFFYISRFTFWIDMLIVVRTIKTLVTGFGSR